MPEKVHKKFGESQPTTTKNGEVAVKQSANGRDRNHPESTGLKNGVKRLRDGSPKRESDSKTKYDSGKNNGKQGNSNIGGKQHNGQPASKKMHMGNKSQGNNNGTGATGFATGFSGKANGQGGKFNGVKNSKETHLRNPTDSHGLRKIALELEKKRKELPIWGMRDTIKHNLRWRNNILLLNGETGSGKSTQVPQFLCNEPWCKRQKVKVKNKNGEVVEVNVGGIIAITQPRRVAAISLARRVAAEMGCALLPGAPGEVGYAVRFDSVTPMGMKIKFVTEGILLQEMLHDPQLKRYSAVIVDEIHERSVDVDLISGFLRTIAHSNFKGRGGIPLKIVIMSATLDLGGIEAFFSIPGSQPKYQPGQSYGKVFAPHLVDPDEVASNKSRRSSGQSSYSSWSGFADSDEEEDNSKVEKSTAEEEAPEWLKNRKKMKSEILAKNTLPGDGDTPPPETGVEFVFVQGRQYDVDVIYEKNPSNDYLEEMLKIILHIHVSEPLPGDILAFLTGQDEIETLQTQLEAYAEKLVKTLPRMKVLPLYGSLAQMSQQEVFEKVKQTFTRKIVLATNIAETSVTVSGVRYVVDCGKSKVKQYRPRLGMESLLIKPISMVSAIQRAGRAGREAKGKCYRIYTEEAFWKLDEDELPEILRSDVIEAVLKMKARGVDDVLTFPLMDSPDIVAMEKALLQLHMMGALNDQGQITDAGRKMAAFPLPAAYGRVLIAAAEPDSDVLLEAIDVIACLNTDSELFLQPKSEEQTTMQEEFRQEIAKRHGDVITILGAMQQYAAESTDRIKWCKDRLISAKAMRMAMQIRRQLRQLCHKEKLLSSIPLPDPQPFEQISPEKAEVLLKTFLKAFVMKTAILAPDGSYLTTQGRNVIAIHPSSVLYGKKVEAIMFLEHVFTAKSYAKKVSAIQANWIEEAL